MVGRTRDRYIAATADAKHMLSGDAGQGQRRDQVKVTLITKWEQINRLKKGDQLMVCWSKSSPTFKFTNQRVHLHYFIEKKESREIILTGRHNPYFSIKQYLLGRSAAHSVSLVEV